MATTEQVGEQTANSIQHGGTHYKKMAIQPWDYIVSNELGYLEGNAVKYLSRWREKNGVEDLKKAIHYIEKLIETEEANNAKSKSVDTPPIGVNIETGEVVHDTDLNKVFPPKNRHSFLPENCNPYGPYGIPQFPTSKPLQFNYPNPPMVEESKLVALQAQFEAFKQTSAKEREALCEHIEGLSDQIACQATKMEETEEEYKQYRSMSREKIKKQREHINALADQVGEEE